MRRCLLMTSLIMFGAGGIANAQTPPTHTPATQPTSAAPQAAPAGAALDQSAALGVLAAVNTAEIEAGQLALKKDVQGPVRAYAQRMIDEHRDNNAKLKAWRPDANADAARMQMTKGKQTLSALERQNGDAFSKAYVDAMVKDHAAALKALDEKLIPAATSPDVATHLRTTRSHVQAHLQAAQQLAGAGASR